MVQQLVLGYPNHPRDPQETQPAAWAMILQDPQRFSSEFLRSIETFCSLEAAEFKAQRGWCAISIGHINPISGMIPTNYYVQWVKNHHPDEIW